MRSGRCSEDLRGRISHRHLGLGAVARRPMPPWTLARPQPARRSSNRPLKNRRKGISMKSYHSTWPEKSDRIGIFTVCLAVLGGYTSQQILNPILPQLSREIGLSDVQLGVVISSGAAIIALLSPLWGRLSDRGDHRWILVLSLTGTTIGLLAFAIVAQLAVARIIGVWLAFTLFILSRGLIFGAFLAGLHVAAQSYVADVTEGEKARVSGISLVGASVGFGLVAGPGLGGLLAQAGLVQSLFISPALLAIVALVVWGLLPRYPQRAALVGPRSKVRFADARTWPFLLIGSGIYLSASIFSINAGFLVQDRLQVDAIEAAGITGIVLFTGGIPMLLVQGLVIPRLGWSALVLIKVGLPLSAAAFVQMTFAQNVTTMVTAALLAGIGHSFSIPGYTSALTLLFDKTEQGGVAGLISSTNAVTMVVGPIIATTLYQVSPSVPFAVGASVLAGLFIFALAKFRSV